MFNKARVGYILSCVPSPIRRIVPGRIKAQVNRILGRRRGVSATPIGDVYYGDKAMSYVGDRAKHQWWENEQEVMRQLLTHVPDNVSVLDAPFGTGRFVPFYLEKGMSIHGLEISTDMIKAAQSHLGEAFEHVSVEIGDARQIPFNDKAFAVTSCFRFLQSIVSFEDAIRVIRELTRVSQDYVIVELGVRDTAAGRTEYPNPSMRMGGWLYYSELETLLSDLQLRIEKTEGPIECVYDDAAYYVFLCRKQSRDASE